MGPLFGRRLLPWTLVCLVGGVLLYVNGLDPTGSVIILAGMLGVALTTIRMRWEGTFGRLGARLRRRLRDR